MNQRLKGVRGSDGGCEGIVQLLNLAGGGFQAPLISASARGHERIERLLLNHGPDVGLKSKDK